MGSRGVEGEDVLPLLEVLDSLAVEEETDLGDGMTSPGLTGDEDPVPLPHLAHHVPLHLQLEGGLAGREVAGRDGAIPLLASAGHGVLALHLGPGVTPVLVHGAVHQGLPLSVRHVQHPALVAGVLWRREKS